MANNLPAKPDCIFCKIVAGEAPCHKIWEDEKHLAFLSIFPNTEGFSVVIPKAHYSSYAFAQDDQVLAELVIANKLHAMNLPYRYEEFFIGNDGTRVLPDFTFVDAAGERVVWEHLGMMDRPDYRDRWEWKRDWYKRNGLVEGETLFVTEEREGTGLDSQVLTAVAEKIRGVVA